MSSHCCTSSRLAGASLPPRPTVQSWRRSSNRRECAGALHAVDPGALQDIIVGSAVTLAVGGALYLGLRKDPVPCDLCMGNGGVRCFACAGEGKAMNVTLDDLQAPAKRDAVGRRNNQRECRVCKGGGLVLCSKCRGKGYMPSS